MIFEFDRRCFDAPLAVDHLNRMDPTRLDIAHFSGDRVVACSREAVDASPDQEVRAEIVCKAEQLVDVTFAVANMNTAFRCCKQRVYHRYLVMC